MFRFGRKTDGNRYSIMRRHQIQQWLLSRFGDQLCRIYSCPNGKRASRATFRSIALKSGFVIRTDHWRVCRGKISMTIVRRHLSLQCNSSVDGGMLALVFFRPQAHKAADILVNNRFQANRSFRAPHWRLPSRYKRTVERIRIESTPLV